ncbi:hypothetical protein BXZ70DRAFT_280226 [Cristinia sonorae]|uniref:Uncharacterized protein n=1 Tax=Cristinia sonorae TaxID=1940300 RepID=A0A8K0UXB4_9AGAR|nr:hypothetical protein BXZ70DRAFT_280226 [Cristinia sonorae]
MTPLSFHVHAVVLFSFFRAFASCHVVFPLRLSLLSSPLLSSNIMVLFRQCRCKTSYCAISRFQSTLAYYVAGIEMVKKVEYNLRYHQTFLFISLI